MNVEALIPRGVPVPDFEAWDASLSHHFVGDVYAKLFEIPRGVAIGYHQHSRDHRAALLIGQVMLTVDGISSLENAPATFDIPAGKSHRIDAMTPALWACLWDNPEGHTSPEAFDRTVIA